MIQFISVGVRTDCTGSYIRETARRLSERVIDHAGRDRKSHIVKHCLNSNYETVNKENFKILKQGTITIFINKECL